METEFLIDAVGIEHSSTATPSFVTGGSIWVPSERGSFETLPETLWVL
jgi:hypothetical protein